VVTIIAAKKPLTARVETGYSPRMIKGVKFVSIPVADQDRALAFYTEKLGFRILTDQPFDDKQRWIELSIPGAETAVVLFTPQGHESHIGGFSHATFYCDDAQRTYDELSARGVEFAGPPQKQPWGTFLKFKDPDGNQFVVSSR
jgi:catechol 2,3-dioxygenase-like lactoylglutathione lyase family enzyme